MDERRKNIRLTRDKLPLIMQNFTISFDAEHSFPAETLDASKSGICLTAPIGKQDITDHVVTLQTYDKGCSLQEEFVYIKPVSEKLARVSIAFNNPQARQTYLKLFSV